MARNLPGTDPTLNLYCGFPGETEEDFQMLLDFLKEAVWTELAALNTARLKVQTPMPA